MLRAVEQPQFLDQSFFQAQAIVTPALAGQEQPYLALVNQLCDLTSASTQALADAIQPLSKAQDLLTQKQQELGERKRFLAPDPILDMAKGGFRRSLGRARVHLHEGLRKNTIPWPLIWVARRFAWDANPALSPFTKAVVESRTQLRDAILATTRQRELLAQTYATRIHTQQSLLDQEESRLLETYEFAIAEGGDLRTVSDYLTLLPNAKREDRSYPAVETFVYHKAFALLQTDELKGFEDYVSEMRTKSTDKKDVRTATRLKEFIDMVKLSLTEAQEQGTPPSPKLYTGQDQFVTRRFEAYLIYSILLKLHQQDLLTNQLAIPALIQYW